MPPATKPNRGRMRVGRMTSGTYNTSLPDSLWTIDVTLPPRSGQIVTLILSFSSTMKRYRFIVLENDKIKVTICPDLGGRVTSIVHKGSGKEVLYVPDVIRPTRILPRFGFVAGGIEVSFPISHSPTQNDPVLYAIDRTPQRV